MSETDNTKLKQNFLKKEILEKGYDVDEFAGYLESRKENGKYSNGYSSYIFHIWV